MPTTTNREENSYALPADTPFQAVLQSVEEKTIEYFKKDKDGNRTNEKDSFSKWVWTFDITEGEYAGMRAWGETRDSMSTHPDNKVRQWAETLTGKQFGIGDGLDTDDLLGLPCIITVRHDEPRPKANGDGFFYGTPVDDVFPSDALGTAPASDPPF